VNLHRLATARALVMLLPALGLFLGISSRIIYPLWILLAALLVVITFIAWHREGRSFKPLVPMAIALTGALLLIAVWFAL
jgi:hypothetical protein